MDKFDMFLTLKKEPKTAPPTAAQLAIDQKFQEERHRLIEFLFTNIHYRRIKDLPLETMLLDIHLHHHVGPSRAVTLTCRFLPVYDTLALSLVDQHDRLHAGLSHHSLVAVTLNDSDGERPEIEIPLSQYTLERRMEGHIGQDIRASLEQLFNNQPKPSPFLLPVDAPLRDQIITILLTSRRVQRQLQQQGFRRIAKNDQRGLVLLR